MKTYLNNGFWFFLNIGNILILLLKGWRFCSRNTIRSKIESKHSVKVCFVNLRWLNAGLCRYRQFKNGNNTRFTFSLRHSFALSCFDRGFVGERSALEAYEKYLDTTWSEFGHDFTHQDFYPLMYKLD